MRKVWLLMTGASVLISASAWANCYEPSSYDVTIEGNTVTVSLRAAGPRTCPDSNGLLRQEIGTGAVVKLADFCGAATTDTNPSYIDECVPPGTYHYGLASPYTACGGCSASAAYGIATVTSPLDGGCARSSGNPGPTAATSVPWGASNDACTGCGCGAPGGASGSVLIVDALVAVVAIALLRRRQPSR